jgi:hypothetical protein
MKIHIDNHSRLDIAQVALEDCCVIAKPENPACC